MVTKDGFPPDDRYPVFLSEQAEETVQPDIGKALGRAALSSRILKASIWAVTAPAIQSIAGTQDLPSTTSDAPPRDETAAAVEPADQSQAEVGRPLTEALFKQFQAWADEQNTRAQVEPKQPEQAAPVRVVQDAPAQVRPAKKHRRVRSVQNARAEIRPPRHHRARTREESAPMPIAPA